MRLRAILLLGGLLIVTQVRSLEALRAATHLENLTAEEIIMRAVDVAERLAKEKQDLHYEFFEKTTSEQFDTDGNSRELEEVLAKVYPLVGALHRETLQKNGQPLSPQELKKERSRREQIRRRRERGEKEKEDYRMGFNRELVERYQTRLIDEKLVGERPTYTVYFEPKGDALPIRRRMDYALNKSYGRIFVDKETFQIARVEFELMEPVNLWWGLLGKLYTMKGVIERGPLVDGVWVGRGFEFSMKMRIFFKNIHTRRRTRFFDYQNLEQECSVKILR